MTEILITGSEGFLGRNLVAHLEAAADVRVTGIDIGSTPADLYRGLQRADLVFHLAGANRPPDPTGFDRVNRGFTAEICDTLRALHRAPKIVFASSIQADLDNPYGASKLEAERLLRKLGGETGAIISIYRLKNVFGKWSRPNYNSVVATFCHNIANHLPVHITDARREIELVYVGDVVAAFLAEAAPGQPSLGIEIPSFCLTLGDLVGRLQSFHEMRDTLLAPDFSIPFNQQLYATYLSYVPADGHQSALDVKSDSRGCLAEFMKSPAFGQIFVSRTRPGVTRGNHYHHTKTEKFLVLEGNGIIRLRHVHSAEITAYRVSGSDLQVIDIPPGHTHSIENVGSTELVTLFWASHVFDPDNPDTYFAPVIEPVAASSPA